MAAVAMALLLGQYAASSPAPHVDCESMQIMAEESALRSGISDAPYDSPGFLRLLKRPKSALQALADTIFFPIRVLVPDPVSERFGISSLRTERMASVLREIDGRCLDVGAHDNLLLNLYKRGNDSQEAAESVGVDVVDWGADCLVLPNTETLPFADGSFQTVTFVACINHIPERRAALAEARRVLAPDGRVLVTMISRFVGALDHRLRWWGEHSERDVHDDELDGMDSNEVAALLEEAGFEIERKVPFFLGLNCLYIARPA